MKKKKNRLQTKHDIVVIGASSGGADSGGGIYEGRQAGLVGGAGTYRG